MLTRRSSNLSSVRSYTSSRSQSPTGLDWDADDEGPLDTVMSADGSLSSRPLSVTVSTHGSSCRNNRRPTVREILSNSSPPPWTLTAFMAYLSSNHCLETLEFTMDAGRYKKHYAKMMAKATEKHSEPPKKELENMKLLWHRLIDAYIKPNGSREVNIPSEVRDPLVQIDYSITPPEPETLDLAVAKVYELMEDSVLVPFLNSLSPQMTHAASAASSACPCRTSDDDNSLRSPIDERPRWRMSRNSRHSPPPTTQSANPTYNSSQSSKKSPTSNFTTAFKNNRFSTRLSPTSSASSGATLSANLTATTSAGSESTPWPGLTDDSGEASSPSNDSPMTPPMSPPASDFASSPRQSRDSGTWKKLGRLSQWKPMKKKSSQNFRDAESMP